MVTILAAISNNPGYFSTVRKCMGIYYTHCAARKSQKVHQCYKEWHIRCQSINALEGIFFHHETVHKMTIWTLPLYDTWFCQLCYKFTRNPHLINITVETGGRNKRANNINTFIIMIWHINKVIRFGKHSWTVPVFSSKYLTNASVIYGPEGI